MKTSFYQEDQFLTEFVVVFSCHYMTLSQCICFKEKNKEISPVKRFLRWASLPAHDGRLQLQVPAAGLLFQAPWVTHGEKYTILEGDWLACFRSDEAGQGKDRSQTDELRVASKSSATVPSRCFRAWFGCSHRDGWCHLRCCKPPEMSTWASRGYSPCWRHHALLE